MNDPFLSTSAVRGSAQTAVDAGLRAHMQRVFNYMAAGLAVTGALAFLIGSNPALMAAIFGTPLKWLVMLAPLGFILFLNFRFEQASLSTLQGVFWAFCGTMGVSMATIFAVFAGEDIARAFFITAATFAAMSLWGYTTRRDLTSMGAFMMMGLLGLFIASLVNIFLASSGLQWVISAAGVVIFTALTAYDVQNIKQSYASAWGEEANHKVALIGALNLYLNFINAFRFMLSLIGGGRSSE